MLPSEAQCTVESLLQAHSIAVEQVRVLCRSAGRYWIHQQSCDALASTYKQALQKLTNMLTEPLLSQHLNPHHLQLLVQPALDMLLTAIHQGKRFLETCGPSVAKSPLSRHRASSSSSFGKQTPRHASFASNEGSEDSFVSSEFTIADDKSFLLRALLKGHATDAFDVHLHDFLIAFSAVGAAVEDLNAQYTAQITKGRITQHPADQAPSPDLFWKEQNKPHVLLVSAQHLDHVKHHDDTVLNAQLEHAINQRGYPDDVNKTLQQNTTITIAPEDAARLAIVVKDKMRAAKQAFQESISHDFLDINKLEVVDTIIDSFPTTVHKVMWLGRQFALKFYKKAMEEAFLQEAKTHFRLHHPNVLHLVALFKGERGYGILLELMDESLKSFLQRHASKLSLQEKVGIMLQIAKGMAYVHEKGIIHRDLKLSNVLVRSSVDTDASRIPQLEVKIADFGESRSRLPDSSSFRTKRMGTTVYRAPEVLNDDKESLNFTSSYKRSADVYSFAMTCFELLAEKEPFQDSERRQALWERVVEGERPDLSDTGCPPYLEHCLKNWWAGDPRTRHSFTHICCILRHLYVCLARCQRGAQPISQVSFLAWPFWRWSRAQDIALERMEQFEMRRENDDWKDKGYLCESTRVNEIPYELHVMKWAIKKAAVETEEAIEEAHNPQSQDVRASVRQSLSSHLHVTGPTPEHSLNRQSTSHIGNTEVPMMTPPENTPHKSFVHKLREFCCFSAHITPTNHEAFHSDIRRRNL